MDTTTKRERICGLKKLREQELIEKKYHEMSGCFQKNSVLRKRKHSTDVTQNHSQSENDYLKDIEYMVKTRSKICKCSLNIVNNVDSPKIKFLERHVLNTVDSNVDYDAFKSYIDSDTNLCNREAICLTACKSINSSSSKSSQICNENSLNIIENSAMKKEFEEIFSGHNSKISYEGDINKSETSNCNYWINVRQNISLRNQDITQHVKNFKMNSLTETEKNSVATSGEIDLRNEDKYKAKEMVNTCKKNIDENSECRKDFPLLSDTIQNSICRLGLSERDCKNGSGLLEKTLDSSFKLSQFITNNLVERNLNGNATVDEINWNDEFLLNSVLNMSSEIEENFTNIIKKALLQNAEKLATVKSISNDTIIGTQTAFVKLGSFYDLPDRVKDLIKIFRGIETLYGWQEECLTLSAVKLRKNLVYALPTSGGKTLVAEILILREIMCRKKNALLVLPFVAIVQEKVWGFSPFAVALDFLVEEYAAGKGTYPPRKRRRKNCVYVATIEKALGLINSLIETGRLDEIGLVIIDELHLIGDKNRGPTLEALLTKLMVIKENIQIIGMSATIGNLEEICQFLDADIFTQNFRPIELTEYVKCENELFKINSNIKDENELFTFVKKVDFQYSQAFAKLDPDMLGGLVMEIVPKDSCLIFCSTKKNCENVAHLLSKVMFPKLKEHRIEEKEALKVSLKNESGSLCSILNTSISFGVAYHHSGLTSDERRLIEDGFRLGILCVICCTSTLAAGVNLPAKRVILRQPYIGREFINLSRYKQMVGRAGRAGFGQFGESILLTTKSDLPKVTNLLLSQMDQAVSHIHEENGKGLMHLFLSCINLGIANNRLKLQNVACQTLLGVQQEKLTVNVKKLTDRVIGQLFKFDALDVDKFIEINSESFVENTTPTNCVTQTNRNSLNNSPRIRKHVNVSNDTELVISKLGSATIKSGLDLSCAHILYEDLLQAQASLVLLNCLHLLYLITPYNVLDQVTPSKSHYYGLFIKLQSKELQTAKVLGLTESCAVKLINNQPMPKALERVLNRFYVTLMLYDLWNEVPVYEVSEKYKVPRGIVQNLMTLSATFSSNVVNFCTELEEFWAFAHLLKGMTERLQHCCVRELKQLMELPSVKQNRAKQLYNAGYKTLASVAKADPNDLIQNIDYMSRKLANELIAAAKLLLLEKVENLREEAEDVLEGINHGQLVNHTSIQ